MVPSARGRWGQRRLPPKPPVHVVNKVASCNAPVVLSCNAPIAAKTTGALHDATLFTTFPEVGTPTDRAGFDAVADQVKLVRYGMDCYAYALLAGGHVDLVIEAGLQAYDIQGPLAVIEAAGGLVTDWRGGPAHEGGQVLAAAHEGLHRAALERLAPFAD